VSFYPTVSTCVGGESKIPIVLVRHLYFGRTSEMLLTGFLKVKPTCWAGQIMQVTELKRITLTHGPLLNPSVECVHVTSQDSLLSIQDHS